MNKERLLFLSLLLIGLGTSAQKQTLYFVKNNGQYVKLKDSADYLRIIEEPEQESEPYAVTERYLDGTAKSTGFWTRTSPPVYEGQYISYYRNGKKKIVATYKNGKLADSIQHHYPNGNLYTNTVYVATADAKTSRYIKNVKDSTGKDLVVNGNGACNFYDQEFKRITESGSIKNGVYEGVWTGSEGKDGATFKETYAEGKMISGERTEKDGRSYAYTKSYIEPRFKGGMENFYAFLKKTLRYPSECRREGIEGKVMLGFTVMKDGSITNIKVLKTPHPLLAAEAVRVANASPVWEPGIQRGKPTDVVYNLPVEFKLGQ